MLGPQAGEQTTSSSVGFACSEPRQCRAFTGISGSSNAVLGSREKNETRIENKLVFTNWHF